MLGLVNLNISWMWTKKTQKTTVKPQMLRGGPKHTYWTFYFDNLQAFVLELQWSLIEPFEYGI